MKRLFFLKGGLFQTLSCISLFLIMFLNANNLKACHALPLVNPTVTTVSNGIEINASSNELTCGCWIDSTFWMDIEIRCISESFDIGPFAPNFYLANSTYPYYQSGKISKFICVEEPYPTVFVPFEDLCPGDYKLRMRENHNGSVSSWTSDINFTVPSGSGGAFLSSNIEATKDTICDGECTTIYASANSGCNSALEYDWSNGDTTSDITVCPNQNTIYSVDIKEGCLGDTSATIDIIVDPILNSGTASVNQAAVCEGDSAEFELNGHNNTVQWQTAPDSGGPWEDLLT